MEENRLKPMIEGYDEQLFNTLFKKTDSLRKKLASGIDAKRFGVEFEDVVSWFNTKFIFVFTKYYDNPENILLGYIINSLQTYKNRILRKAYTTQFSQTIISTDDVFTYQAHLSEEQQSPKDTYYTELMQFMKRHLSDNAYCLLEVQLNPPPFIISRQIENDNERIHKIPDQLLLEYFDLGLTNKSYIYLESLKKEIKKATQYAKEYFKNNPL